MGAIVPWTGEWEPTAETEPGGLIVWRFRSVPSRLHLFTRRQLRDRGLSIGPQSPAGRLVWGPPEPRDERVRWAWLYRLELARPRRRHTPAQERARQTAMAARRTCHVATHLGPRDVGYCVPRTSIGGCLDCWRAGRCEGTQGRHPDAPPRVLVGVAA